MQVQWEINNDTNTTKHGILINEKISQRIQYLFDFTTLHDIVLLDFKWKLFRIKFCIAAHSCVKQEQEQEYESGIRHSLFCTRSTFYFEVEASVFMFKCPNVLVVKRHKFSTMSEPPTNLIYEFFYSFKIGQADMADVYFIQNLYI